MSGYHKQSKWEVPMLGQAPQVAVKVLVEDKATMGCFLVIQLMVPLPSEEAYLVVVLLLF